LKLLHVLSSLDPGVGGPLEGVRQRGLRMQQLGHQIDLISLDDPQKTFVKEFPLTVHALGPSYSHYCYNAKLVPWLESRAGDYDAVIVHGLWQYHGFAVRRALRKMGVPYYVFTHGMIDPWFKRTYPLKHFKKWLYWPWAEYRVLRDARAVLFTSEEERLLARQSFWLYRARERVVSYGTSTPPDDAVRLKEVFLAAYPELRGRWLLLFLSRIHEKKGCDLLIRALASVAATEPDIHLVIAGPDQNGCVARLMHIAEDLGITDRITWPGMLRDDMKWGAFYSAQAFILPSHQENFGIAVAEALGCGLPVLISDKVNIWREVRARRAGMVAPDTVQGTEQLLREWLALTGDQRIQMRQCARELFLARFTVKSMVDSLISIIEGDSRDVVSPK
jgi:glycosyltransferase involved in cell wall biosynthesis